MIPIPIKELSELGGCEVEFARRQVYDGIEKKELVKDVHWRSIRGAIVIDLECGLMFLALRRMRKEMGFLTKVVEYLPQDLGTQKALKKTQHQVAKSQMALDLGLKKEGLGRPPEGAGEESETEEENGSKEALDASTD